MIMGEVSDERQGTEPRRPLLDINRVTRRFCASMLVFEAVIFVCATPVASVLGGVPRTQAWVVGGGLAFLALVLCGLLRYRWAYYAGSVLQLVAIASGYVVTVMYFLGVVFAILWAVALWFGRIAYPHER